MSNADFKKVVNDNRDALQALAESDLRSSQYAQALLAAVEGETSESIENPFKADTEASNDSQNQEESLFAY